MSSSATVGVEKATSDLLIGPDWTLNIDICDSVNSHRWQAKDVVKVLKKRLQHKNPKVQLLALTLLETMVKNCGENVHFHIAEKNILQEMIKIVRKKADMHVRDKILVLIDSWQEAFGGAGGKYPQYYWAYEELRRSGVRFPQRSPDAVPIVTPPVARTMMREFQPGYGMPSDTSRRLDEAMASETENLSMSNLDSMQSVLELLADMLQAVNPNDRQAVEDEVIVDLVSQCRSNQKKLVQMLSSTADEELLFQGLALNDSLQSLLAKHDAIASGSPLPTEVMRNSSPVQTEVRDASLGSNATPIASASVTSSQLEEEDEEDDDFAQLARRRSKISSVQPDSAAAGNGKDAGSPSTSSPSNALVPITSPTADRTTTASTTKEQDMIDLLSITLSTTGISAPSGSNQNNQNPTTEGYSYHPQLYSDNQGQVSYSSYVAPWAQPQQAQAQSQPWGQQSRQPESQLWSQQQQAQPWGQQQQTQQWGQQQTQPQQSQPWAQQVAQPQQSPRQSWSQPQQLQSQPWIRPHPWSQSQAQPQQSQTQPWAQPQRPQSQPWAQTEQPQSQPWAQPEQPPQPWARPEQPPQPWAQPEQPPQPWARPEQQQPEWAQQPSQLQSQQPPLAQPHQALSQNQSQAQPQQALSQNQSQAQPQQALSQNQSQAQPQQALSQNQSQAQPQEALSKNQSQAQPQAPEILPETQRQLQQVQPQSQQQPAHEVVQQSSRYPPPPWATTPASFNQSPATAQTPYDQWISRANSSSSSYMPKSAVRPVQTNNSFPARRNSGQEGQVSSPQLRASLPAGPKQFVPSYRLFEDLNVLGSADAASNNSPKMSGQSMVGGKK